MELEFGWSWEQNAFNEKSFRSVISSLYNNSQSFLSSSSCSDNLSSTKQSMFFIRFRIILLFIRSVKCLFQNRNWFSSKHCLINNRLPLNQYSIAGHIYILRNFYYVSRSKVPWLYFLKSIVSKYLYRSRVLGHSS